LEAQKLNLGCIVGGQVVGESSVAVATTNLSALEDELASLNETLATKEGEVDTAI
jgi:hypothetical protein